MAKSFFFDLNVHSGNNPGSSPKEMALMACYLGFGGIGLRHEGILSGNKGAMDMMNNFEQEFDPDIKGTLDPAFKLFNSIEIHVSKPAQLHGLVGKHRRNADVLIVRGGDETINRYAVENPNVDILSYPLTSRDSGINHVMAKEAGINDVAVAFDLGPLIKGRGGKRVRTLSHYRTNLMLLRKYDVPMILTCNASSYFDLRSPRELIALSSMFGMEKEEAIKALSHTPEAIIRRNMKNENYICEGVEIFDEYYLENNAENISCADANPGDQCSENGGGPE